ncbi:hypothetical protein DEU56DRAFT_874688 [Suillus clintonianus]|uniref:uncharacterized protein n=1 Tax=Suillus clintonianus TaxID=1904413 RepID=UPI001B875979|nr:uncharacterized protein DEU56DRAFT_874688 [Suillus clintonianus]KAG2157062.1 hypothetical protein DEU56DRAFT_874688 [Suillus clintonianus]
MQSNRPTVQAGKFGLPSSPACTRPRRDAPFVEGHSRNQSQPIAFNTTRPLRPRRPMASVSVPASAVHVTRAFTRPGPHTIGTTFDFRSQTPAGNRESSTSAGSESSASSFSFQGRMKGAHSQFSSSTSLEDFLDPSNKSTGPDKTLQTDPNLCLDPHEDPQHGRYFSILENGDSVWNRVAAAASVLTVNVNKAWYSRIGTSEGEETAPGRDSHLIRVMKAYHLAKARHPSDLPDWLFDERERKPSLSSRFTESPRGAVSNVQPLRPPAFRHVYDDAASRAQNHPQTASHVLVSPDKTSKAAERLKAFRDAKRADLGVRHVSSKSESLSYSPSRIHTNVGERHSDDHRGASSSPTTRRPLLSARPSQPGAF